MKFNQSFENEPDDVAKRIDQSGGIMEGTVMQRNLVKAKTDKLITGNPAVRGAPFLARFAGKFVLDIMPAALASVIGGFLFTQYHFGHGAPKPVLEQVTPASAEMMAMVRNEHAMITDYLKTQMAAEKSRVAVEDADLARAQEDAKLAEAKAAEPKAAISAPVIAALDAKPVDMRPVDAKAASEGIPRRSVASATKPVVWHAKPTAVPLPQPAPRAPLVIAQADPNQPAQSSDHVTSDPDSLLGKALDLKDHVVAGARRTVAAIGDMFAAVGSALTPSATLPRQLTASE